MPRFYGNLCRKKVNRKQVLEVQPPSINFLSLIHKIMLTFTRVLKAYTYIYSAIFWGICIKHAVCIYRPSHWESNLNRSNKPKLNNFATKYADMLNNTTWMLNTVFKKHKASFTCYFYCIYARCVIFYTLHVYESYNVIRTNKALQKWVLALV